LNQRTSGVRNEREQLLAQASRQDRVHPRVEVVLGVVQVDDFPDPVLCGLVVFSQLGHEALDVLGNLRVDVVPSQVFKTVPESSFLSSSGIDEVGQDLGVQDLGPERFHPDVKVTVEDLKAECPVFQPQSAHAQQGAADAVADLPSVLHRNDPRFVRSAELDQTNPKVVRVHVQPGGLRVNRQTFQIPTNEIAEVLQVVSRLDPVDSDFLTFDLVNKPLQ